MLFLLVVQQLETWKQTAALKWDLCLFPVQAAEGQPGPASPSSPPTAAQAPRVRGAGLAPRWALEARRGSKGGTVLRKDWGLKLSPVSSATPAESHQLCDRDQVTAPWQAPTSTSLSVKWTETFRSCCGDRMSWRCASPRHTVRAQRAQLSLRSVNWSIALSCCPTVSF